MHGGQDGVAKCGALIAERTERRERIALKGLVQGVECRWSRRYEGSARARIGAGRPIDILLNQSVLTGLEASGRAAAGQWSVGDELGGRLSGRRRRRALLGLEKPGYQPGTELLTDPAIPALLE